MKYDLSNLSRLQFEVTQNDATEPPFLNEFFDHEEKGIYVDIVSGEPLFASIHKFDAGCGWPSFYKSINDKEIKELEDNKLAMPRTEVRSKKANSHLGHVFNDGPRPTGLRYCINSAALRFIPFDKLDEYELGYLKEIFL